MNLHCDKGNNLQTLHFGKVATDDLWVPLKHGDLENTDSYNKVKKIKLSLLCVQRQIANTTFLGSKQKKMTIPASFSWTLEGTSQNSECQYWVPLWHQRSIGSVVLWWASKIERGLYQKHRKASITLFMILYVSNIQCNFGFTYFSQVKYLLTL